MIFSYKNTAHVNKEDIVNSTNVLRPYVKHLNDVAKWNNYQFYESSINLPIDEPLVQHINALKKSLVNKKLKYIIVIGIGGSNFGTKAIYDAIKGYYDVVEPDVFPKIIFVDTSDSQFLNKVGDFLAKINDPEEVLINAISKSGSTTETISNFEILLGKAPKLKSRLVITTDFDSPLWRLALDQNIKSLPIPSKVGGRYSVFSAVGLFPLLCAGINIFELLEGALDIRSKCLNTDLLKNPAAISATALFLAYKNGKNIHDTFIFHPELESLGKWYRQLMGESIGKDGIGITPTVSIGSTDLHSVLQLYLGGPKDKFFTFISNLGHDSAPRIPKKPEVPSIIAGLEGKSTDDIMSAIFESVKKVYAENKLPYLEIQLTSISEKSLGKFMQMKMMEIMYLGHLLGVNAFDQPNVEAYKIATRATLSK